MPYFQNKIRLFSRKKRLTKQYKNKTGQTCPQPVKFLSFPNNPYRLDNDLY